MVFAEMLDSILLFLKKFWYWIVIGGLVVGVIILWLDKKKSKVQYYSQIEVNKTVKHNELEFNPSEIKYIKHRDKKYKVLGHIIRGYFKAEKPELKQGTARRLTEREIMNLELEAIKSQIGDNPAPEYIVHEFLVKRKQFLGPIYTGDKEIIKIKHGRFTRPKKGTIRFNEDVWLIYRKGFFVEADFDMINIVAEDTERIMKDLEIDARGQQQKDFSRIRSDYAHVETMKDKDIEVEKEKEKGRRFGGRN
jgi:hypothetical protein